MKRRGSALVFVMFVVFSITAVVVIHAKFASAAEAAYKTKYAKARFSAMAMGLVDQAKAECYQTNGVLPPSFAAVYSGGTVTAEVAPHPTMARAYELKIDGNIDDVLNTRVFAIGNRRSHPVFFGFWCGDNYSDSLLGTSLNGSGYFKRGASFGGMWNVTGDLLFAESMSAVLAPNVGGNRLESVRDRPMQSIPKADLQAVSTPISTGNRGSFTFSGVDGQGYYPCHRRGSSLNMTGGVLSGKGTVFVDGNLDINGNYNYANAQSRVVFLVDGDLNVNTLVTQIAGTFYVKDDIKLNGISLNVIRGNLCAKKEIKRALCALQITQDEGFLEDEDEALGHRLPGYWTASTGPR